MSVTPTPEEGTTPEAGEDRDHLVETQEGESTEENTVMNFFKTLVSWKFAWAYFIVTFIVIFVIGIIPFELRVTSQYQIKMCFWT